MVKAEITWIKQEEGGRVPPPEGTRYTPLIEIEGMNGAWSSDFQCTELDGEKMIIQLDFLSKDAPKEILEKDIEFKLYVCKKMIAVGVVLD